MNAYPEAFKQPQEFDKILDRTRDITTIHKEDKTTGLIYFKNCNKAQTLKDADDAPFYRILSISFLSANQ